MSSSDVNNLIVKKVCCCETSNIPHCLKCSNTWLPIPESEPERLSKIMILLTKNAGKSITKQDAIIKTREILKGQNNTCAFGSTKNGKYCLNGSKDEHLAYLKMEVTSITPLTSGLDPEFIFLCNRCNQIKSSRTFPQLKDELLSKLYHVMKYDRISKQHNTKATETISAPSSPSKHSITDYFDCKKK
jgi:hypothetical protein